MFSVIGNAQIIEEVVVESPEMSLVKIPTPDLSLRTPPTHQYVNDTLWYSYDWTILEDKKLAHYYRIKPKESDDLFLIEDYYLDGTLQMSGTFIDFDGNIKHGEIHYFRPNGALEYIAYYGNDKFLEIDRFDNNLNVIEVKNSYINFNLPDDIEKKTIEESESDFSFKDLFNVEKQIMADLNIDESIYKTKQEGNKITTTELKTGNVVSTLYTENSTITDGFLNLYSGSRLIADVKRNKESNAFEYHIYHKNGNVFLVMEIETGASKYFSDDGKLIAENDGNSGSFILGIDATAVLGFSYVKPIEEGQSFVITYLENGKILYTNQYYSYGVPYRLYDEKSGFTREYKEDGTIISEYINPDPSSIYGFGLEDKLTDGYRSSLYKSKSLKRKAYFKPTTKTVEYYRDDESESLDYKEFFKKDDVDDSYFFPHQIINYNKDGVKIFEAKLDDSDEYTSVNYDDKGKKIGEFKCDTYGSSLSIYPTRGRNQDGYIAKSLTTDSYEMFKSPQYEDINVDMKFEVEYDEEVKKKELLSINNIVFIDFDWNGESTFYDPIEGKHVTCVYKEGKPFSGHIVNYDVSAYSIELETIEKYSNGELWYKAEYKSEYLKGTYIDTKTEIIDGDEIITRYLSGVAYRYNKTKKDGRYLGSRWGNKEILENNIYYPLGADLCIIEFKDGILLNVENYKKRFFNKAGEETPNTEHYLLANKLIYDNGSLERIESYYDPDHIFKNLRNKMILQFRDEMPYDGELLIENFSGKQYYRVRKGEVLQKLLSDYKGFYEITPEKITTKTLRDKYDASNISYTDYIQKIDFLKEDYSYDYTAIGPDGDEHKAEFDGIKMKSGVFYFEKTFDGVYTLIVKDDILYMIDKYIDPSLFRTSQAIKQIPISSSKEEFEEFYDFYDSTTLMFIDEDYSLELNFTD